MSALALPPAPTLRLVPAPDAGRGPGPGRACLRVVTSEPPPWELPAIRGTGAGRRPVTPRTPGAPRRGSRGGRGPIAPTPTRLAELAELSPTHPAVRARRRRDAPGAGHQGAGDGAGRPLPGGEGPAIDLAKSLGPGRPLPGGEGPAIDLAKSLGPGRPLPGGDAAAHPAAGGADEDGAETRVPLAVSHPAAGGAGAPGPGGTRCAAAGLLRRLRRCLKGFVVAGVVLALLVAGAVLASGPSRGGQETGATTTVTVSAGQTLWDIAAATGRGDVMETAALIVELNHLSGTTLRPGQRLIVPRG
ncbi:LysM peptidoglycan-binding domain-containing protein [uncultured Actinomyces sp.]|uniref:LysM peptidoglycan-binding domain-containing protein n=1 Tax=uncultured Actinomyces sp. TaxID=249061 RepID=UPI0028DCFB10|nr:LysM peptidoglycan-binding domain-containing protein [uncultured Actinomyces sp.]